MRDQLLDSPELKLICVAATGTDNIAWTSRPARQRLPGEIITNIRAFQAGEPRNQVN